VIDRPVHKLRFFCRYQAPGQIVSPAVYDLFSQRFEKTFGFKPGSSDFRLCVCYAESGTPRAYQTAFVFLAFYGMARNLTLVFISYALWETTNAIAFPSWRLGLWGAVGLAIASVFFYHYLRFLRYFKKQIVAAFLVGSEARTERETHEDPSNDQDGTSE